MDKIADEIQYEYEYVLIYVRRNNLKYMYSTTGSDLSILPYINNLGIRINIFMKYHWLAELLKENNVEKYYSTKQKIPLCSAFTS